MIRFVNVYRLPMGRDKNDSVCKCLPCLLAGHFWRIKMDVNLGKSYHIKDSFFDLVNDSNLMANKEGKHYRPHFFLFADTVVDGIYWAVPQSSRVEKYKDVVRQKIKKYGKCNTIVIGKFGGTENAFLIQNMFPITKEFVDHEHLIDGKSVKLHSNLEKAIVLNAKQVLSLHRHGKSLFFTDVDRIYDIMKNTLKSKTT